LGQFREQRLAAARFLRFFLTIGAWIAFAAACINDSFIAFGGFAYNHSEFVVVFIRTDIKLVETKAICRCVCNSNVFNLSVFPNGL